MLEGPFEPVTVPLDTSFRGDAVDLSDLDSRVKRTVTGWMPEQVMVSLSDEHSSVWISWITENFDGFPWTYQRVIGFSELPSSDHVEIDKG
ncbi:hypothetical protein Drorol1_Dr00024703 [Drosera rotundifolia]